MSGNPERAARALLEVRDDARPIPLAERQARGIEIASIAEGYAVQDRLTRIMIEERGRTPIGYKIGATNAAARTLLGVSAPFFGRLYAEQTLPSPTAFAMIEGVHPVCEPEIAVEIGRDLSPADAPFDADAIRAATRALLPAIEIIVGSFEPWTESGGPTIIADNGAHGVWIPGAPIEDWSGFDPIDDPITVSIDGAAPITGRGGAVDGGPFAAAAWLANELAARGEGLAAGARISTGTVTPPVPMRPGLTIVADCGALGTASLTIRG